MLYQARRRRSFVVNPTRSRNSSRHRHPEVNRRIIGRIHQSRTNILLRLNRATIRVLLGHLLRVLRGAYLALPRSYENRRYGICVRWERGTKDGGQLFTIFLKILKINTKIQIDSMFSLVVVGGWEIHPIQFCLVVAILPGRDDRLDWVYPNLLLPLMTSFMTTMKRGRGIPHSHQTIATP